MIWIISLHPKFRPHSPVPRLNIYSEPTTTWRLSLEYLTADSQCVQWHPISEGPPLTSDSRHARHSGRSYPYDQRIGIWMLGKALVESFFSWSRCDRGLGSGLPFKVRSRLDKEDTRLQVLPNGFIPGTPQERPTRCSFKGQDRKFKCEYEGCTKSFGSLYHLNRHVEVLSHGPKRGQESFASEVQTAPGTEMGASIGEGRDLAQILSKY